MRHADGAANELPGRHAIESLQQFRDPLTGPCGRRDDRHSQLPRQLLDIDADAVPARFVHQIQTDHNALGDFHHLQGQVQIPLQACGIQHDERHVGLSEQNEIARNLFVGTGGQ